MSNYFNYTRDFPKRCKALLERTTELADIDGLEVTLSLTVAAAGIVVPFERLKSAHPFQSHDRNEEVGKRLTKVLEEPFLTSILWGNSESHSWKYGTLTTAAVESGSPDNWDDPEPVGSEVGARIVSIIRNALAHGNLRTWGRTEIEHIIFVAEHRDGKPPLKIGYRQVRVSPADFRRFLIRWFDFLIANHLDQEAVGQMLHLIETT